MAHWWVHRVRAAVKPLFSLTLAFLMVLSGLTPVFAVAPLGNSTFLTQTQTQNLSGINGASNSNNLAQSVTLNGVTYYIANGPSTGPELYSTDGTSANTNLVKDVFSGASGYSTGLAVSNGKLFYQSRSSSGTGSNSYEPFVSDGTAGGTTILKDVNPNGNSSPYSFAQGPNGLTYFLANDGSTILNGAGAQTDSGAELWVTDGIAGGAGTYKVKDINTYSWFYPYNNTWQPAYSSSITGLTACNGLMFFSANSAYSDYELWVSDGTTAGTRMVKDINSTLYSTPYALYSPTPASHIANGANNIAANTGISAGASPSNLTCVNNTLFFSAFDGSVTSLWKSDGTAGNTVIVRPVADGSYPQNPTSFISYNNKLIFSAAANSYGTPSANYGQELWISDGTSSGTKLLKDIYSAGSSSPTNVILFNGMVYFSAMDDKGVELWRTDGTTAGTLLVKDINQTGSGASSSPSYFYVWNNKLYFTADNGISGRELYATTGTGVSTYLVKDIFPGISDILDVSNYSFNQPYFSGTTNALVFTANSPIYGQEMWKTDGTESGTTLLQDLNTNPGSAFAHDGIAFNGKIYFSAASAFHGQELWSTDLTTGNTQMVIDIFPGASSGMDSANSYFTIFNGRLYFTARNAITGWELWSTDGTAAGTSVAADMYPGYGNNGSSYWPSSLTVCNGKLFYAQYTGYYTILAFDGTSSTVLLNNHLFASNFACLNNTLFFSGQNYVGGSYDAEIWKTTGTLASTSLFADIYPGTYYSNYGNSSSPGNLTVFNNKLYFTANNPTYGQEIWSTDGVAAPVALDIYSGAGGSNPSFLRIYKGELYFKAHNGSNGNDLMSYDGTTLTPRDLVAGGAGISMDTNLVASGDLLWFRGYTSATGYELWSSDGTEANTGIFEDLSPGSSSTTISALTAIGGVIMYNTYDTVMGSQPRFVVVSSITTVTFNANGATGGSAPADISVMSISATLPGNTGAMVKTNFNFTGWNTNALGTGTSYLPGATISPIVDTPLYAMWASVSGYTVTYNANGATSGAVAPPATNVTSLMNLDTNSGALAKTGYSFGGWNTLANGTGTNYASGARYTPVADVTLYARWIALTPYSISFNVNGGTGSAPATINTYATATVTLPSQGSMVAPAGKTFAGWNTNSAGSGAGYAAAETLSPQSSMTLYAQWTNTPSSTLTYNANGSTSGSVPSALVASGTYVVIDSNTGGLAKTGYVFSGWNTQADGSGTTYQGTDNYLLSADVTLYAYWVAASYTVTFSGNNNTGGTAPAPASGISVSTVLPANSGNLVRAGYSFAGWNTLPSGLGTNYATGDTFSPTSNVTLFAKWNALPTYTITYSGNGATSGGVPVAQSGIYSSVTLDNNSGNLAKTNYFFGGWNTQADGLGTTYAAGSSYTPTSNITLYAIWSAAATYTITYFGNSNTSGTAPLPQTGITSSATISGNTGNLARLGYRWDGWNTQSNGSGTAYASAATISPTSDVSLYAQWISVPTYTITFNGNGQTSGSIPSTITSSDANVTLPGNTGVLNKTNYTFNGWNTSADGTGTHYDVASSYPLTTNVTLYAEWLGNIYTLTYNANGSTSGTIPNATTGRGTLTTATNTGLLAKTGYSFSGWNTAGDGTGTSISAGGTYTPTANTTLFAKWTALPAYTISYNGNGHTGGSAPAATSSYAVQTVASAGTLVKSGSNFLGWNTAANGSGTSYSAGSSYSTSANVTLYAQWGSVYDLSYDANGADGGSAPATVTGILSSTTASAGNLVKTGYGFNGWNTAANGSGTAYATGVQVNLTANLTLYAQWVVNSFSLTYSDNGATAGSAPMTANSNNNAAILDANTGGLEKSGYVFAGWNTRADGTGTTYSAGQTLNLGSNVVLYALWVVPAPKPKFEINSLSKRKLDISGGEIEITGSKLALVDYISMDGKKLSILYSSDSKIVVMISAHAPGKVDLIFKGEYQQLTYQSAIEFISPVTITVANVLTKNGRIDQSAINWILLEAKRNRVFTDMKISFSEQDSLTAKMAPVSIKDNLQLLILARQIVNLIDHTINVSVQVRGNTSQLVLSFSVK